MGGLQGLKEKMLHNLGNYITELLEWTDTAFATLFPHDDMVLIEDIKTKKAHELTWAFWVLICF